MERPIDAPTEHDATPPVAGKVQCRRCGEWFPSYYLCERTGRCLDCDIGPLAGCGQMPGGKSVMDDTEAPAVRPPVRVSPIPGRRGNPPHVRRHA